MKGGCRAADARYRDLGLKGRAPIPERVRAILDDPLRESRVPRVSPVPARYRQSHSDPLEGSIGLSSTLEGFATYGSRNTLI